MPGDLRARLDAAIDQLDDAQRQRLLDWAGSMRRDIENARAPGASIGPIAEMLHITRLAPDGATTRFRLEIAPDLLNPHGVLHGGAVYTMIDYSMGAATMDVLPAGEFCATIEIKVSYLAGVREGVLTCDTSVVKQGANGQRRRARRHCERLLCGHTPAGLTGGLDRWLAV